jgi:hypothetical protein
VRITKNDTPLVPYNGFSIDFDTGVLTFDQALHYTDKVDATYNFRWFSQEDMLGFLNDALNLINIEPPGTSVTLDNLPTQSMGVLLHGAAANALQSLMFCLMFQKPSTVFGGKDEAKQAFGNFESLKQNHEEVFKEAKKTVKRSRWPAISSVIAPEFTLPGGRCIAYNTVIYILDEKGVTNTTIEEAYYSSLRKKVIVLSTKDGGLHFSEASKIWKTSEKDAYEIRTEREKSIVASEDHLFLVEDAYIPVSEMKIGDSLTTVSSFELSSDSVVSIEKLPKRVPMFDIEVPETGNLIANDIVCHNSRWFRYLFSTNVS